MGEPLGNVLIQGGQEQQRELRQRTQDRALKQGAHAGERVIEEELFRHFRGVLGGG